MRLWSLFAVAAVGLAATALLADDKKDEKFSDQEFVKKAAGTGLFEVREGQLALRLGRSADARQLAQNIVNDHIRANQELMALVSRKGWIMPRAMSDEQVDLFNRLARLQGAEFDKTFLDQQLKAHEKAVELFEQASKECQDPDLKAWAAKTLPTLRQHLETARKHSPGGAGGQDK
jgi:putative membrane protein